MWLASVGAIAFSGKAIIVKLAYGYGVDAVTLIMWRMVFSLPIFLGFAWWGGRNAAPMTRRDLLGVVVLGCTGYYLASLLDFMGLQYISASLERLILYLNPTMVLLLGWLLHRRGVVRRQWLGMSLSYVGVLLVFGRELHAQGPNVGLGATLVFLSAVSYAIYLTLSPVLVQRLGALRLVGWATSIASVLCVAHFVVTRPWSAALVPAPVLGLSLLNAILCTAVPVLLVMLAIERIGAATTAQIGMIGPMSTLLMGVVILGEPLSIWLLAGTALVLAGIMVFSARPRSTVAAPPPVSK